MPNYAGLPEDAIPVNPTYAGLPADALTPETPASPSRLRRLVADPTISAVKGVVGLGESAVGLADIVTGGAAGNALESIGYRPKQTHQILDSLYSPEQQAANAEVAQADGILPTIKASFRNPSVIAHQAIESAPSMLGAGGLGRALVQRGVPAVAAAAAGEGLVSGGSTAEQVRQETGDLTGKQALIAAGSGAATAGLGYMGGKLANRLGFVDPETLLAGGAKGAAKLKAIPAGMVSEGILEEAPQSAQEQAAQNLATGKPVGEGVGKAAVSGAITGGVMGGAFNAAAVVGGLGETHKKVEEAAVAPVEERRATAEALGLEAQPGNPVAAAAIAAAVQDKLDAGEEVLPPVAAPKVEDIISAVEESITSGKNPMEILKERETSGVAEALKTDPLVDSVDPLDHRAAKAVESGRLIVLANEMPDAELAAKLDDMGFTLEKGARVDMKDGGIARREWVVKEKPVEAPTKQAEGPAPISDGETRQAYPDNPNLQVKRVGNQIALADVKNKEVLGVASIKDGVISGWVEGKAPSTVEERSQVMGVLRGHMGDEAPRFERVRSERAWSTPQQRVSSASTSISYPDPEAKAPIIFSAFKAGKLSLGPINADIGGGRFDQITTWLQGKGVENVVWDRFNRDQTHNDAAQARLAGGQADTATVSNVLNVIPDKASRLAVIATAYDSIKAGGKAFFSTYTAPKAGDVQGRDAYQTGLKTAAYIPELEEIFGTGNVERKGDILVATKKDDTRFQRANDSETNREVRMQSIRIHLAPIIKNLKVPVEIVEHAGMIPNLRTDVEFRGAYHRGKIYLNLNNLHSIQEAEDTLLKHEIRHAGLRTILGKEGLNKLLAKAWGDLKSGVREFAAEKGIDTKTKAGKLEAMEEYIVELARTEAKSPLWDKFVSLLKQALRSLGFEVKYSDAELRVLVAEAGRVMATPDLAAETRFARVPTSKAEVTEFLKNQTTSVARRALSDITSDVWRAIMPIDRTIEMVKSMPAYRPISNLLSEYVTQRKAKAAAVNVPPTYGHQVEMEFNKAFKTTEQHQVFDDLVAKATIYELHADGRDAGWTEKSWREAGKEEKTGLTLGQARTEIRALYDQLSPAQREVHRKVIDHMKVLFDQLVQAELEPLKTAWGETDFKKAEAIAKVIWGYTPEQVADLRTKNGDLVDLALQIAEKTAQGRLKGDYAPLMRYGNHIVRTLDAEGNRLALRSFESKQAAISEVEALRAKGFTANYELLPEASKASANIPLAFLDKMRRAAEARGITGDALESLMDDFAAARVQTLPRTSLAGTTLQREGVAGYDTDMLRAYASYTNKAGHAIANAKYGRQIEQTFRDMDAAIRTYAEQPDSDTNAVERMASLKDKLYRLDKEQEQEKVNEFVKALGKTSFIYYLSSPSVYAVQWAQPFITTIPKMASKYGFGRAFAAYTAAAKRFLAGEFSDEKIDKFNVSHENAGERLYKLIEAERKADKQSDKTRLRRAALALYNGFDANGQRLLILKVLGLQGALDISSSHELMDLITGASKGAKALNKVTSNLAFFMQKSETGSRRAAAVAAFQIALENGKDFVEANDYASEIIGDTLGDFTTQNRPQLLRGNVGRVIGQFRFYQLHMLGKTVQLMKDAYQEKGWGEKKKEMAYMLGMSMSLAGAAGTPIAMLAGSAPVSLVLAGLSLAFGDPDDPWDLESDFNKAVKEAMGDEAGNVFLKGLPALLGMDISRRIGMNGLGNIINGDPPPGLTSAERAQWIAGRMLGPSFGMAADATKMYDALTQGDLVEAAKAANPKPVKDFFKAMSLAEKGAIGAGGRTVVQPEDVSPVSIALQALGVNPMEVALAQEERREIANLTTELKARRSFLLKKVTEATLEGDYDKKEASLEAINEWGGKHPALKITQQELLGALKRGQEKRKGALTSAEEKVKEEEGL